MVIDFFNIKLSPHDLTEDIQPLKGIWTFQRALADLRGIYALYQTLRRFEKLETTSGRIPSPKQAWIDMAETILYDPKNNVEGAMNRVYEIGTLYKDVKQVNKNT